MENLSHCDEDVLICMFQETGDESCFSELAKRYRPLIYHLSRRYILPMMDQNDYIQESHLVLYEALKTYERNRTARFSTYYRRMLSNHFCQMLRYYTAYKRCGNNSLFEDNPYDTVAEIAPTAYGKKSQDLFDSVAVKASFEKAYELLNDDEKEIFYKAQTSTQYRTKETNRQKIYRTHAKLKRAMKRFDRIE